MASIWLENDVSVSVSRVRERSDFHRLRVPSGHGADWGFDERPFGSGT